MDASDGWTDDDDVAGVDDDDDGWGAGEDKCDVARVVGARAGADARSSDGWDEDEDGSNLDEDEDDEDDEDDASSDGWGDEDAVMTAWGASMMRARAVTEEATTREEEEEDAAVVRERRFATLALDRPNASGTETESEEEEMFARPRVFVEMELRESAEAEKREALRARDVNAEATRDGDAGKMSVAGRARASRVDAAMEFDEYDENDVDDWDDDVEEPREDAPRASSGARAGGGLSRMGLLPARNIAETHPWRSRLPHFVPVTELAPQSFHEGELVHVDYLAQFGGPRAASARARPASAGELVSDRAAKSASARTVTPRWYTDERGVKTFVDARGVSRTGKAAYKASQKAFG
tara:strand:+ start:16643 stop:17701 length:1059 start_codon:yes stop_codon:yes gene_type:complete